MKYYGEIQDPKDCVTKEYVDNIKPPDVTSSDNGKVLMVVDGTWAKAGLPVYDGTVISNA